jgi:tungstate transport system substrate-binding protein
MKKLFIISVACATMLGLVACGKPSPKNPVIRLSTTTSVNDSGLLPYLQPYFEGDTGYKIEVSSLGTTAAIEKARKGDADALLVHSKSAEETFVNEGFGETRVSFIYNYFVIVGPKDDPAGVKNTKTAGAAFQAIANAGANFITRGDASGTNNAELNIWKAIKFDPTGKPWYINIGSGMGQALIMADQKNAYTLSDKATYLATKTSLTILLPESDDMKNTYSMIAVSTKRWPDTNYAGAMAFITWMTSIRGLDLISKFGVDKYGQQLFFILK